MQTPQMLKLILIGDSGVGKTSLIHRYVMNQFDPIYKATIGCDFLAKSLCIDNVEYVLQIWDTAGHERFSSIVTSFYRGSDAVIIVFDVTNSNSFQHISTWINEFNQGVNDADVPVVICGNKIDSPERCITTDAAKTWCDRFSYSYVETSALTSQCVDDLFSEIVKLTIEKRPQNKEENVEFKPIPLKKQESTSTCC
ncbi:GTP-binding protein ypt7 [Entamoeba marina]